MRKESRPEGCSIEEPKAGLRNISLKIKEMKSEEIVKINIVAFCFRTPCCSLLCWLSKFWRKILPPSTTFKIEEA
jgi:hypothetical protein